MAFKILALTGLAPVAAIVLHTNAGYTSGPPSALAWLEFAFSVYFLRGFSMCFLGLNLGDGFRLNNF